MYYGYDAPYAAPNGMGAYFTQQAPAVEGLAGGALGYHYHQEPEISPATAATVGTLWLVARATGGYVAGRAMAPTAAERHTWGVVGSLLGTLGGPLALGLIGLIALRAKG